MTKKTINNNKKKNNNNQRPVQLVKTVRLSEPRPKNTFLGDLGALAGNGLSKIFGLGAYQIKQNNIYKDLMSNQVPVMHSSSESITFRHREYISDVTMAASFTASPLSVNPGMAVTFPYLSAIAQCFQEYEFKGLVFEFKSTTSDAIASSTNLSMGTVIMAAQYRADAATFTSKQQMENEMWSASCKPSECMVLPIECSPAENAMGIQYVRSGTVTGDIKLYDLCTMTIATTASQAGYTCGELWASYEVVLKKPALVSDSGTESQYAHYAYLSGNAPTASLPLRSFTKIGDTIGCTLTSTTCIFPAGWNGVVFVSWQVVGSSTASLVMPILTGNNGASQIGYFGDGIFSKNLIQAPLDNDTAKAQSCQYVFLINSTIQQAAYISWGTAGTIPASVIGGDLLVTTVSNFLL